MCQGPAAISFTMQRDLHPASAALLHSHPCPRLLQYLGDVPLAPGEETSAEYVMFFPRQLPPREFILKINLVVSTAGKYQQKLMFNETINIIEEPTLFDTQLIGLYLIGLAAVAGCRECCAPPALPRSHLYSCLGGCTAPQHRLS